jgi:myo-inositol 2-dehydrogenase/D-chiro-inositol 1-dehydrogenase/scyllo-inositol 2-dehydrogenase (NAD+)
MIHARNFARGIEGARLVALVDPVAEARSAAMAELGIDKGYADYRQALEDREVGAVVVVTPTVYHHDIVVAAAASRKHVFCEKPMAMNVEECSSMVAACEKAGVKLQIGFMRRYAKDFQAAKAAIDRGSIGEPVLVKSLTRGPSVPQKWMYDIAKSNGPLAEVNSHDIDTVRWLAGDDISEIYAVAGNYRCPEAKAEFPDFYDTVAMTLRFAKGAKGMIDGAVSVGYGYDARVEILGTKGVLFIGSLQGSSLAICTAPEGGPPSDISIQAVPSWRNLFLDAYREEDQAFVRAIREDLAPMPSGRDGLKAVEAVVAGNRSIVTGVPVKLS